MLKLLKYEWKACARICLPLYGAMLLMSIINALMITDRAQDITERYPDRHPCDALSLRCWLRCSL